MSEVDKAIMPTPTINGITKVINDVTMIGTTALIAPLTQGNSASRLQMATVQSQQRADPLKPDLPFMMSGGEKELGKYTFDAFMPCEATVVAKIPHYVNRNLSGGARDIPFTLIYRSEETGEYDFIEVNNYVNNHTKFGHKLVFDARVRTIQPGDILEKGQRLTRTTNIHEGELHSNTLNTRTIYVSDPASIEDGFRVTPSYIQRSLPLAVGEVGYGYGAKCYPIYCYGTREHPETHPRQGDTIRSDGIVACLREYREDWDWLMSHETMLHNVDMTMDNVIHGQPNAEVIDIEVVTTSVEKKAKLRTNPNVSNSLRVYHERAMAYSRSMIREYSRIMQETNPKISLALARKFAESFNVAPNSPELIGLLPNYEISRIKEGMRNSKIKNFVRTKKNAELDEWTINLKYAYRYHVGKGAKYSDNHG